MLKVNKFLAKYLILISIYMEDILISKVKIFIILWRPFVQWGDQAMNYFSLFQKKNEGPLTSGSRR